jgi:hypothetical protein
VTAFAPGASELTAALMGRVLAGPRELQVVRRRVDRSPAPSGYGVSGPRPSIEPDHQGEAITINSPSRESCPVQQIHRSTANGIAGPIVWLTLVLGIWLLWPVTYTSGPGKPKVQQPRSEGAVMTTEW